MTATAIYKRRYYLKNRKRLIAKQRAYYKANKVKVSAVNRAYALRNKEVVAERYREWARRNRTRLLEYRAQWVQKYPERLAMSRLEWRQNNIEKDRQAKRNWQKNNPDRLRAAVRAWHARNPERALVYAGKRRAIKQAATVHLEGVNELYAFIRNSVKIRCFYCTNFVAGKDVHVDHFIPLSRGGKHSVENLRASCAGCNLTKHNKLPSEWRPELFGVTT